MKLEQAHKVLKNIPHMTFQQAQVMTKFILDNNCQNILELGFERGVSTCYMAAVLDEIGNGSITTIDLDSTRTLQPNIESLLDNLNLSQYVTIYYESTSYTWRLMKFIEEQSKPLYDLCYLDGAHSWFDDGFAFFLVDKLLAPGGWIILDDVDWTFANSAGLKNSQMVKDMPEEERDTPQIRKVYELLVKTHPDYDKFKVSAGWAYARKNLQDSPQNKIKKEVIHEKEYIGLGSALLKIGRKIVRSN